MSAIVVELADVSKRFGGTLAVDNISLQVREGDIVSLLGPSGCGKTTTLRLVAGFEMPDSGRVEIRGQDMKGRRPYERNVGLLFQDYALFPHMTVEQNIAYGLRRRGARRAAIPSRVAEMLKLVSLTGMGGRQPGQLSGGQQQRVALARALATSPEVVLLDEPLSALDAKLRHELRTQLKEILTSVGATTIVVTHDQEEAMSLGKHIVVMNDGKIVQQGSPADIYSSPASKFVAEFIGKSNWLVGRLGAEIGPDLREYVTTDGTRLIVQAPAVQLATSYQVCIRPERIQVLGEDQNRMSNGSTNVIRGTIEDVAYLGADLHIEVDIGHNRQIAVLDKNRGQYLGRAGQQVTLQFAATDCILIPFEE